MSDIKDDNEKKDVSDFEHNMGVMKQCFGKKEIWMAVMKGVESQCATISDNLSKLQKTITSLETEIKSLTDIKNDYSDLKKKVESQKTEIDTLKKAYELNVETNTLKFAELVAQVETLTETHNTNKDLFDSAEKERKKNELKRIKDEESRKLAEVSRVTAEDNRKNTTTKILDNVKKTGESLQDLEKKLTSSEAIRASNEKHRLATEITYKGDVDEIKKEVHGGFTSVNDKINEIDERVSRLVAQNEEKTSAQNGFYTIDLLDCSNNFTTTTNEPNMSLIKEAAVYEEANPKEHDIFSSDFEKQVSSEADSRMELAMILNTPEIPSCEKEGDKYNTSAVIYEKQKENIASESDPCLKVIGKTDLVEVANPPAASIITAQTILEHTEENITNSSTSNDKTEPTPQSDVSNPAPKLDPVVDVNSSSEQESNDVPSTEEILPKTNILAEEIPNRLNLSVEVTTNDNKEEKISTVELCDPNSPSLEASETKYVVQSSETLVGEDLPDDKEVVAEVLDEKEKEVSVEDKARPI